VCVFLCVYMYVGVCVCVFVLMCVSRPIHSGTRPFAAQQVDLCWQGSPGGFSPPRERVKGCLGW
jgi:hypothetical protein